MSLILVASQMDAPSAASLFMQILRDSPTLDPFSPHLVDTSSFHHSDTSTLTPCKKLPQLIESLVFKPLQPTPPYLNPLLKLHQEVSTESELGVVAIRSRIFIPDTNLAKRCGSSGYWANCSMCPFVAV